MIGINDCNLVGNIVRDAELSTVMVGDIPTARCKFKFAVNEKRANGSVFTSYFNVTIWRDQATNLSPWLLKGRLVYVHGKIGLNSYVDKEHVVRNELQVHDAEVKLLDKKPVTNIVEQSDKEDDVLPFD